MLLLLLLSLLLGLFFVHFHVFNSNVVPLLAVNDTPKADDFVVDVVNIVVVVFVVVVNVSVVALLVVIGHILSNYGQLMLI